MMINIRSGKLRQNEHHKTMLPNQKWEQKETHLEGFGGLEWKHEQEQEWKKK